MTAFAGLRPEVVHICSALTYTLLVLLAAFVARGRARGAEGSSGRCSPPGSCSRRSRPGRPRCCSAARTTFGTAVPVLVLLLLLDWAPARWYALAGAGVLLAAAIVGDPLAEVVGVLPLFLGCLIRAGRILWRAGRTRGAVAARRPGAAGAAPPRLGVASRLVRVVARGRGGAGRSGRPAGLPADRAPRRLPHRRGLLRPAAAAEIVRGVPLALRGVLALFGADSASVTGAGNVAFALVHLIGVAVVLAAVLLAAVAPGRAWCPAGGAAVPRRHPRRRRRRCRRSRRGGRAARAARRRPAT